MIPSSYPLHLRAIGLLAQVIRSQHLNHDHRNERLGVLRTLIEMYARSYQYSDEIETRLKISAAARLTTLFDLCYANDGSEDHTLVKSRLRLVEESVAHFVKEYEEADKAYWDERVIRRRVESAEIPTSVDNSTAVDNSTTPIHSDTL